MFDVCVGTFMENRGHVLDEKTEENVNVAACIDQWGSCGRTSDSVREQSY